MLKEEEALGGVCRVMCSLTLSAFSLQLWRDKNACMGATSAVAMHHGTYVKCILVHILGSTKAFFMCKEGPVAVVTYSVC